MISPFQGEPKPLEKPITPEEVRKSFNSLNNNNAPGEDEIHAELLKYGTPLLDQTIVDIFNTTFNKHEKIDINGGVLIAIQKPGKKKGPPNNLRPITLLNSLRKALSVITLNRIKPDVERYLSNSQSGFRPNRSTADVVWTHKWLSAKTLKEDARIKITGIDMSAAFDTINRSQILDILKTIIKEDELRIIRFLLSNTEINTKINGSSKAMPFMSNVGTPQGDSLSPVLFIIYLENALREIRTTLPEPNSSYGREIPSEIAYADDVDFIGHDYANIANIQETLEKYQLKVNIDKTEFTLLSKSEED
ncbi:retrovirus-related Pol polyprotein LINE-1 [Elysia marginata]|uniref:Retrovirus-related Pol polyprotein LINE-1 n=1 Tax=Elysia marginata TaxID=1093978 RepID=A0AAV4HDG9_9GAST|nr:retrovirus-related Pol polyprotein LINE-1 [Elysia marginata]